MKTYFAPPERASEHEFASEIQIVSGSSLVSGLLASVQGLLAILDEHRQIVAINDNFLKMIGVEDPELVLGLRQGEALKCIHADEEPGGCGTSKFCSTCGAAVAIVASLGGNVPVERKCTLTAMKEGKPVDIMLVVKSQPVDIREKRFLLLLAQDITVEQQRAALERTFFHDLNNMLGGLLQASEMLEESHPSELTGLVAETAKRLCREVAMQRCLSEAYGGQYKPLWNEYRVGQFLGQIERFFEHHPAAKQKHVEISACDPSVCITTDVAALSRITWNMVINALEATDRDGIVKVWVERQGTSVAFCVWNHSVIPPDIAMRIFQRNFSTKEQAGRGLGTYSMKLFGEQVLGGQVKFTSAPGEGTTFRFLHPERKSDSN